VVLAPRRLVYSWQWDGEPDESLVTVEFSAVAEGTEVSVTHDRLADAAQRDAHLQGWTDCTDRLAALLR